MPTKVILDVDTGTDDAVALMLAALHPEIDLIGACSVSGNVPLKLTTENTLRVFDHIDRPVPVYQGLDRPIAREDFPVPRATPASGKIQVHGEYLDIPESRSSIQDTGAVEFLIETYRAATEEIVLIPVGPLSNIAAALRLEPKLAELVPRVIIMGGAHHTGNITPRAEFNVWADPEAAHVVFHAGFRDVTLVPLDATHKALVSTEDCAKFRAFGTPAGEATATFVERRIRGYDAGSPMSRLGAAPVHDALCVAAVVQPDVITTEELYVTVETHGETTVGETVVDVENRSRQEPNMKVAFEADERAFVQIMMDTFAAAGSATSGS